MRFLSEGGWAKWASTFLVLTFVAGVVAAVSGLLAAIGSDQKASEAERRTQVAIDDLMIARKTFERDITKAQRDIVVAQAKTAEAEQAIAEANRRTAVIETQAARLTLELAAATDEITGRSISDSQSWRLVKELMPLGSAEFIIICPGDEESIHFARSMAVALRSAAQEVDIRPNSEVKLNPDANWEPVTIVPPKRYYPKEKLDAQMIKSDKVISPLIAADIVQDVGDLDTLEEYYYVITIPPRFLRGIGTLKRESKPAE